MCTTGGTVAAAMWTCTCCCVFWNVNILGIFNFYVASVSEQRLKYLLNLKTLDAEKLPDNGTLMPKHVGVGI